jgi:hypothetical protein
MPGRGLVIAAAVLQLVGAALGLLSALTMALETQGFAARAGHAIAAVDLVISAIMIPASIGLLLRWRWAWWVSIAVIGLFCAALLGMPLMGTLGSHRLGVGLGEAIVLVIIGAPIFATFGLLVAGRRAVFAPAARPLGGSSQ